MFSMTNNSTDNTQFISSFQQKKSVVFMMTTTMGGCTDTKEKMRRHQTKQNPKKNRSITTDAFFSSRF